MKKEYVSPSIFEIEIQTKSYLLVDILSGLEESPDSGDHSGNSENIIDGDFD